MGGGSFPHSGPRQAAAPGDGVKLWLAAEHCHHRDGVRPHCGPQQAVCGRGSSSVKTIVRMRSLHCRTSPRAESLSADGVSIARRIEL